MGVPGGVVGSSGLSGVFGRSFVGSNSGIFGVPGGPLTAFFEALRRGLINSDELEKAASELEHWIERDRKRFLDEQRH